MTDKALPFGIAEFQTRLQNTKASMESRGIDILVAADPANMNYLTGYDGWSFYTPQVVIVAKDLDQPICIVRQMDVNGGRVTTYLDDNNMIGFPDTYVQSTECHPMDWIAEEMGRRGIDKGVIGVEMDAYYYSAASHAALVRGLPNATMVDATSLVNWVRVVKSAQEIEYMRRAARIVEKTMRIAYDMIEPGVRQCDAAAAIYQSEISGTPEFGGDYTSLVPLLPTGVGTSTPHLTWTDQPFVSGEATILEIGGAHRHYHCPMARTMHLGKPPQKLADTSEVVVEGIAAALDTVKPGALCEDVEAAWRHSIAKHGLSKDSRLGYSTGVNYPPDWGEHTLSLRQGDKTVLQPNMTIHLIAGIWMDDWGIEISECFRVSEDGCEKFCDFPEPLFVKD
jgi:ectoine hydrolase